MWQPTPWKNHNTFGGLKNPKNDKSFGFKVMDSLNGHCQATKDSRLSSASKRQGEWDRGQTYFRLWGGLTGAGPGYTAIYKMGNSWRFWGRVWGKCNLGKIKISDRYNAKDSSLQSRLLSHGTDLCCNSGRSLDPTRRLATLGLAAATEYLDNTCFIQLVLSARYYSRDTILGKAVWSLVYFSVKSARDSCLNPTFL